MSWERVMQGCGGVGRRQLCKRMACYAVALVCSWMATYGAGAQDNPCVDVASATDESPVWVDIRSADAYARCRIPGSLNVPPFQIKTMGFLRGRPVVLVNDGFAISSTRELVVQLQGAGFSSIRYLCGGIQEWVETGGSVEGDGSRDSVWAVTSAQLLTADSSDWIGVVAADESAHAPASWMESLVVLSCTSRTEDVSAAWRERGGAESGASGPVAVLISSPMCTETRANDPVALLTKITGRRPYSLAGGWAAYVQSARLRERVVARTERSRITIRTTRETAGCTTCPQP